MTTTTDTELDDIAAQLADVLATKTRLEQQEKHLKELLRKLACEPGNYPAGNLTVTVSTNNRFSPDKALPLIPADLLPLVTHTETVVDKEKLKALLPEIFEQAQNVGEHRIGLK